MNEPAAVITLENVSHSFRDHRALEGVSFEVRPGSLHGFIGPNGAGKTTTLKLICTLLRPQMGRIRVFGHDIREDVRAVRRRLGFMPDHFSLYRQMTVYEYLDFFAAAYGFSQQQRDRIVADILQLTDLQSRRDDLIQGLSRGLQQRVSLARVLVNDPELLLLDEPASGLDPRARIELMEILHELQRMGKTIFISSHILSELAELCDSVTIIDRGRTCYSGPMTALLEQQTAQPLYRLQLEHDLPGFAESLSSAHGVLTVAPTDHPRQYRITCDAAAIDSTALLRKIIDLGGSVESFGKDRRHLNEAFMDLTRRGVGS